MPESTRGSITKETTRRRKRAGDPFAPLWHLIDRLPIPRLGRWGTLIGLMGLFVGTLALGLVIALTLRAFRTSDALNPFDADYGLPTATPHATPNPEYRAEMLPEWSGTDRVTILLMGADTRPAERGYARPRTDSIMLLMVDPTTRQASVLSIPRDLYVDIPGYGLHRINTAYTLGGGPLAIETVQYNLGVRIDYYVMVEFDAFVTLVDEIGGIDVYVPKTIYDPNYPDHNYGYDPFYIEAGQRHMDGQTALKYARTRHADNDYERARRQQDVLFAIRGKVLRFDMLPTLIEKSPALYTTMSSSIQTNMTLEQMIELAVLAQDVPEASIRSGVIDHNYVSSYTTAQGAAVLIPNRSALGPYLAYIFWLD